MNIRPLTLADAINLSHVAYETAFFGKSAEIFFPDRALFADLWIRPYLSQPLGFVTEAKDRILGYVLGEDEQRYQRQFVQLAPYYFKRLMSGAYPQWRGCWPYLWRVLRYSTKHAPLNAYPTHLHINLLPEVRGQGLGKQLLTRYLEHLHQQKVSGVQLSTTRENLAAVSLYQTFGFKVWREYESPLWRPWLGHTTTHLVMVKSLR
jgi:ribosomal protein S18 acetylase RimI-like enzyme